MKKQTTINIFKYSTAIICILIGIMSMVAFPWVISQTSFLSTDGIIHAHTLLEMRICLMSLLPIGLFLILSNIFGSFLKSIGKYLDSLSRKKFLLIILSTAMVLRILPPLLMDINLIIDYGAYDELALTWAAEGSYSVGGHPTGYMPPGYPFFLSRIYLFAGHSPLAGVMANIFLSVLIVYLTWRLALEIFDLATARWAAIIMAFFPSQILFVNLLASEMIFTPLFLLSLLLCLKAVKSDYIDWMSAIGSGILLGMATLCRALTQVFWIIPLFYFWIATKNLRRTTILGLFLIAGFAIIITPWIIRNHQAMGCTAISTNGGINLMIGNNPLSGMGFSEVDTTEFNLDDPACENEINTVGFQRGRDFILENPLTFIKRGILKVIYLFATDMVGLLYKLRQAATDEVINGYVWLAGMSQVFYMIVLLFASGGLISVIKSKRCSRETIFLWGPILFWIAVHFVFFGHGRFHFPIMPMFSILAAVFIIDRLRSKPV